MTTQPQPTLEPNEHILSVSPTGAKIVRVLDDGEIEVVDMYLSVIVQQWYQDPESRNRMDATEVGKLLAIVAADRASRPRAVVVKMFSMTELAFLRACVLSYQRDQRAMVGRSVASDLRQQHVAEADAMLDRISEHAGLSIDQCLAAEHAIAAVDTGEAP